MTLMTLSVLGFSQWGGFEMKATLQGDKTGLGPGSGWVDYDFVLSLPLCLILLGLLRDRQNGQSRWQDECKIQVKVIPTQVRDLLGHLLHGSNPPKLYSQIPRFW